MIDLALLVFLLLFAFTAGLIVGWDGAIHHGRSERRELEAHLALLDDQLADLKETSLIDPQRAWIDIGRTSVLNQLERTISAVRATIRPRDEHS